MRRLTSLGGQAIEDGARDTLTVDELRTSIGSMSEADRLRLRKVARLLCGGSGYEPQELVNEVILRALNGTRKCPRSAAVVVFLANAMKSVVSVERDKIELRPEVTSLTATGTDGKEIEVRDTSRNAEEQVLAREEHDAQLTALEGLFVGDEEAQIVIMADIDGLNGEAIRNMQGWNERELATVRRRIRRRIERQVPKGSLRGH